MKYHYCLVLGSFNKGIATTNIKENPDLKFDSQSTNIVVPQQTFKI